MLQIYEKKLITKNLRLTTNNQYVNNMQKQKKNNILLNLFYGKFVLNEIDKDRILKNNN
jgi:hypothetical protein